MVSSWKSSRLDLSSSSSEVWHDVSFFQEQQPDLHDEYARRYRRWRAGRNQTGGIVGRRGVRSRSRRVSGGTLQYIDILAENRSSRA
jgi:hypothetical protein